MMHNWTIETWKVQHSVSHQVNEESNGIASQGYLNQMYLSDFLSIVLSLSAGGFLWPNHWWNSDKVLNKDQDLYV